jgi:hypothetical protein
VFDGVEAHVGFLPRNEEGAAPVQTAEEAEIHVGPVGDDDVADAQTRAEVAGAGRVVVRRIS